MLHLKAQFNSLENIPICFLCQELDKKIGNTLYVCKVNLKLQLPAASLGNIWEYVSDWFLVLTNRVKMC